MFTELVTPIFNNFVKHSFIVLDNIFRTNRLNEIVIFTCFARILENLFAIPESENILFTLCRWTVYGFEASAEEYCVFLYSLIERP